MVDFLYPALSDWTLFLSDTSEPDDPYIICYFRPTTAELVSTELPGSIERPFETIWGAGGEGGGGGSNGEWMEDNPWAFLGQQGLPLSLPIDTNLPYVSGGSADLVYRYVIQDLYPSGFIPFHIDSEGFPGCFIYKEFEITYRREKVVTVPVSGEGKQVEEIIIDAETFILTRPTTPSWFGVPLTDQLIAEDSDLYYVPPPEEGYPFRGVIWCHPAFWFLLQSQAAAVFDDLPTFNFYWGQGETPTEYLFDVNFFSFFELKIEDLTLWIEGETAEDRHDSRETLNDLHLDAFPPPYYDGDFGIYDRLEFWYRECEWPDSNFWVVMTWLYGTPDHTDPCRWRAYYKARNFAGGSEGTGLSVRPPFAGGLGPLPVPPALPDIPAFQGLSPVRFPF